MEGPRRPGVPAVLASRIPTKIQKPMPYATSSSKAANLKIVQKQLLFGLLGLWCLGRSLLNLGRLSLLNLGGFGSNRLLGLRCLGRSLLNLGRLDLWRLGSNRLLGLWCLGRSLLNFGRLGGWCRLLDLWRLGSNRLLGL